VPRDFDTETLVVVADQFRVLAEPMRLRILNSLRDGERTVTDLVGETGSGQANVSRHLGILYRQGMVARRKEGQFTLYRISDPMLLELCELVCQGLETGERNRRSAFDGTDR
jgi:ArsR family transcriptional regulator